MTDPAVSLIFCPAVCARSTACLATVDATRCVRLTIERARARGLALPDRRRLEDLRPVLRLVELRLVELRLVELRLVELRFAELRLVELRFAELRFAELRFAELRLDELRFEPPRPPPPPLLRPELRLAELRFAVRLELPRAADLLRDDFFAAIVSAPVEEGCLAYQIARFAHTTCVACPPGVPEPPVTVLLEGGKCANVY